MSDGHGLIVLARTPSAVSLSASPTLARRQRPIARARCARRGCSPRSPAQPNWSSTRAGGTCGLTSGGAAGCRGCCSTTRCASCRATQRCVPHRPRRSAPAPSPTDDRLGLPLQEATYRASSHVEVIRHSFGGGWVRDCAMGHGTIASEYVGDRVNGAGEGVGYGCWFSPSVGLASCPNGWRVSGGPARGRLHSYTHVSTGTAQARASSFRSESRSSSPTALRSSARCQWCSSSPALPRTMPHGATPTVCTLH